MHKIINPPLLYGERLMIQTMAPWDGGAVAMYGC